MNRRQVILTGAAAAVATAMPAHSEPIGVVLLDRVGNPETAQFHLDHMPYLRTLERQGHIILTEFTVVADAWKDLPVQPKLPRLNVNRHSPLFARFQDRVAFYPYEPRST